MEKETQIPEEQKQEENKVVDFNIDDFKENKEFQKYLQQHADQRVTSAIQKKEQEYQSQLESERKKASMTQEEISQQKQKELQEREEQLEKYELKLKKIDYFKENNIDITLVDYVDAQTEDEIKEKSDVLLKLIDNIVETQVKERLKTNGYTPSSDNTKTTLT